MTPKHIKPSGYDLTTEEKLVAFAMAFVVHAGRAIRKSSESEPRIQSGIDFVINAKDAGIFPTREDLR